MNKNKYDYFLVDEKVIDKPFVENEQNYTKEILDEKLKENLFQFVELERSSGINSLSGKQKRISADIAGRFFKNYFALIALIVFVSVLFISIIVPMISPFLSNTIVLGISPSFLQNMPPSYAPVVTEILTSENKDIVVNAFQNVGTHITVTEMPLGTGFLVTYNKYDLVNLLNGSTDFSTILGTTAAGFDIWTRTWTATRDSLTLAMLVALIESIIGIAIGAYIGFHAGTWIDTIFTRLIDIIRNIPSIIWFLLLISLFNNINFGTLLLSLVIIGWTTPVYQTRLWMITVKDQEYILASKSIGASTNRQIFIHALPAIIGKLATSLVSRIIVIIFFISSLAFLGFIPYGGEPNLGTVLNEARSQVQDNVWSLLLPSIILLCISLSTQFIANGLHDALDPKVKGRN